MQAQPLLGHYLHPKWKSTWTQAHLAEDSWRFLPEIVDTSGLLAGIDLPLKASGAFPAGWDSEN